MVCRYVMGLKDIDEKIKGYYNSGEEDILKEFYIPVLSESIFYRRVTGFFSSTILAVAARGISSFIKNGGKMELVCWAELSEDDVKAIKEGYSEEEIIEKRLSSEINLDNIEDELKRDHLRAMAWMIKNGMLEIKIAVKTDRSGNALPSSMGMFHPKSGLLRDVKGNEICFSGSDNESAHGWMYNIEEFHVYKGWNSSDAEHFIPQKNNINRFWKNQSSQAKVFSFPEALNQKIISIAPKTKEEVLEMELEKRMMEELEEKKRKPILVEESEDEASSEKEPSLRPYYYQEQAIKAWKENGSVGLLSMATGTGKTFTALFAVEDIIDKKPILILVPTTILLEQWAKEVSKIYPEAIILKAGGKNKWKEQRNKQIFIHPDINKERAIISTMKTASSEDFIEFLKQSEDIAVIVDEVHRLGSPTYRKIFEKINFSKILGLSATPERIYDPEGNEFLKRIFGEEPVFEIGLGSKIKKYRDEEPKPVIGTVLSKYEYHFETVTLDSDEQEKWKKYTEKINKIISMKKSQDKEEILSDERLQNLLIQRAKILKKAHQKIEKSAEIIKRYYSDGSRWIVYCEDENQLKMVKNKLVNQKLDIPVLEYHSGMPQKRRERVLKYFEEEPSIVVSIRCLDEGVDIPSVDGAMILASSKNPREYIQRRGRVLRKARDKRKSIIVDTFVLPKNKDDSLGMPIVKGELTRAYEFSKYALNADIVGYDLWKIGLKYGIDFEKSLETASIGIEIEEEKE